MLKNNFNQKNIYYHKKFKTWQLKPLLIAIKSN